MGSYEDELPPEFQDLAELMRRGRVHATPLELDQLKLQIVRRAEQPRGRKGFPMRSRMATLLAVALLTVGAGGTFAVASHDGGGDGSGARTEYHEGKGCDRHHERSRRGECDRNHGKGEKDRGRDEGRRGDRD
jgi:hypothetical protein